MIRFSGFCASCDIQEASAMKTRSSAIRTLVLASILSVAVAPVLVVRGETRRNTPVGALAEHFGKLQFSEVFMKASPELQRFGDLAYFRTLASDGVLSSDPKALFGRITAATQNGEGYKALYFARLFTERQPDNRVGWTNRARLAANLGFDAEAAAAKAIAESGIPRPLAGAILPGLLKVRPSTLPDWAAAVALMADDTTAREGRAVVLAVRDDLSGVTVATAEQIEREARGPWATANPVQIEDVLTNAFVLSQAHPMDRKSMRGGMFALGALSMAGAAYSSSIGATDAATSLAGVYGSAMANVHQVPSDFKGGEFMSRTFETGTARDTKVTPKTSGKHEAVSTPLPLLWASGPSLAPTINAAWRNGDSDKSEAIKIDSKTKKQEWKKYQIPALTYPKLQQICGQGDSCSPKLTLIEVILSADDLRALAPGTESLLPNLSAWDSRYASRQPLSVVAAGDRFTGYDGRGVVYVTRHQPTEWLVTSSAPSSNGSK
jgi:hypothetical protein